MILPNTVYLTDTISLSQYGQCMIRGLFAWYGNRTVPHRKLYQYIECLRINLKWPSTVPIRTIPYRKGCTCLVPCRNEIKTNTSSSRGSWRNNYLPYGAVPCRTAPRAVCGGALYRTGQTTRANTFCGGSRSHAHAPFRYQVILQGGIMILPNID